MSQSVEFLRDIVGVNKAGELCHPFRGLVGTKRGQYSYTFGADNTTFLPIIEEELRRRIEAGEFNSRGRIRMVPATATTTSGAGALSVVRYKGIALPL